MRIPRWGPVVALLLAGCAAPADPGARSATELLSAALAAGDGSAACRELSAAARAQVASVTGRSCAEGVLERLPDPGRARRAEVWGSQAQVRTSHDTVFLSHFAGGWKVVAAGCTPRPGQPYDCKVSG